MCFIFHLFSSFVFLSICLLLFLFSCISFICVSFLAFVAEFNCRCFLRSRCSMEMWCPDDIKRNFNSREWGWRLLACSNGASPDCIIVVAVCACVFVCLCVCVFVCACLALSQRAAVAAPDGVGRKPHSTCSVAGVVSRTRARPGSSHGSDRVDMLCCPAAEMGLGATA